MLAFTGISLEKNLRAPTAERCGLVFQDSDELLHPTEGGPAVHIRVDIFRVYWVNLDLCAIH